MKKFYYCFILSAIFVFASIANYYDGGSGILIFCNIFSAVLFAVLGVVQFFLDKMGEKGKSILKWIYIFSIVIVILLLIVIIISLR